MGLNGWLPTTIAALSVLLTVYWIMKGRASPGQQRAVCALFELQPSEYQLIGTDLGGASKKYYLVGDGLIGVPDALFRFSVNRSIVVGEAKSRQYRGRVYKRERYQVMLYMGVAKRRFRKPVRGILRFRCGTCVEIPFSEDTYRFLKAQIPQYRKTVARFA